MRASAPPMTLTCRPPYAVLSSWIRPAGLPVLLSCAAWVLAPSLQATRPFLQTRSNEEPDPSLMLDEKRARAHLRALRLYTPVGMICNMLDMQTPSAHLEPFAAHDDEGISVPTQWSSVPWERGAWARVGGDHLILDERDEEVAAINSPHSASSVHAALMDKAETRRRRRPRRAWVP